eukprot:CAMPEP_0113577728 /NCGR_PEP_ID=MMETSP0015_2-20120614/29049_1 /TAXON_ID=2838 /ORGANISM="Odontella" /LENGTH=185 /DNA_ID=CAMNT_0000481379 /DNA_START=449 /DNA_END=1009 /DNA_ORIENTATION=- /assembly_acc=CAM_ASM_000160
MVVIVSALVAILTIGLGDDGANSDGVSAYSVFNRGFQRLMGSVDVEALVAQHVGGGLAMQGIAMQQPAEENRAVVGQNQAMGAGARNGDGENMPANVDVVEGQNQEEQQQLRARRSRKKSRRRNLEARREMQRQRQAAAAMGFAGDDGEADLAAMNRLIEDQAAGAMQGLGGDGPRDNMFENDGR